MKKNEHLGVYGVLLDQASLLLVKKNRGPYRGKWDLPGGRPEFGESLDQALFREIAEETGVQIQSIDILTALTHEERYLEGKERCSLYHVGIIYMVFDYDRSNWVSDRHLEDVSGSGWFEIEEVKELELTPFAMRVLARISG